MICTLAKDWLMQAELPRELADAPAEVAEHLRECVACQRLSQRLQRLEHTWREQPLPAAATTAREEFLHVHPSQRPARRFAPPRWLVAASLLLAASLTVWFMSEPQKAHAESDVIEQLIDWNLEMSESSTEDERRQIYAGRVESLRAGAARLPAEDRPFAESLIRNGEWLTTNTEPLEEVERFHAVADQLMDRMNAAAARSDARAAAKLSRQYQFIAARGITAKMNKVKEPSDEVRRRKLEKAQARETKRREKLEVLHETAPAGFKKELRKLLDQTPAKPKKRQGDRVTG